MSPPISCLLLGHWQCFQAMFPQKRGNMWVIQYSSFGTGGSRKLTTKVGYNELRATEFIHMSLECLDSGEDLWCLVLWLCVYWSWNVLFCYKSAASVTGAMVSWGLCVLEPHQRWNHTTLTRRRVKANFKRYGTARKATVHSTKTLNFSTLNLIIGAKMVNEHVSKVYVGVRQWTCDRVHSTQNKHLRDPYFRASTL